MQKLFDQSASFFSKPTSLVGQFFSRHSSSSLLAALCFLFFPSFAAAVQLTINGSNTSGNITVNVYPKDQSNLGNGIASFARSYATNTRVWVTAPLRSGNNYFIKWQKDGVDFDQASTLSMLMDANHTLTALYETPSCTGISVFPGNDSIAAAVGAHPAPGTVFCIQPGIHRFTTGAVAAPTNDQFIGAPGAILSGSKIISFSPSGSYWVATGQTQDFYAQYGDGQPGSCYSSHPLCYRRESVFFDNAQLWPVGSLAALVPGTFFFDYPNDKIYLYDNPTGHTIETTTGSGGLIGYGGSDPGVVVKNLIIEKFGGGYLTGESADTFKASDWLVQNNEFRLNSYGIVFYGSGSAIARNNYVHDNRQYGIGGTDLIEGNVVSHNNTGGWDTNNDAGGSKFLHTVGMRLRGNTFSDNIGQGIWSDYDNLNATYENNWLLRNTGMGIDNEANCGGVIRYNLLQDNNSENAGKSLGGGGGQIGSRASRDVEIYGNDITATGIGVNGIQVRGNDGVYTGMMNCGTSDALNVSIHDNVVRMDATDLNGYAWANAALNHINWTHNTYVLDQLTNSNFVYDSNYQYGAPVTFALWQSMFGQDLTGSVMLSTPSAGACDVNGDGLSNVLDVQLESNMAVNVTACTHDINQDGACNVIDVQRVVNAALGGQCVSP